MEDPNIYAPRHLPNADIIDKALTDALSDALEMRDLDNGIYMLQAQLQHYDLRGSDAESVLLEDYCAGFQGMVALDEYVKRNGK